MQGTPQPRDYVETPYDHWRDATACVWRALGVVRLLKEVAEFIGLAGGTDEKGREEPVLGSLSVWDLAHAFESIERELARVSDLLEDLEPDQADVAREGRP